MAAGIQLTDVSAGRDIRIEKIAVYNIPPEAPVSSYRSIVGVPLSTEGSTIQQRTQLVEVIYTKLARPEINALVLTGLGGMGKSTLAALLYQHVQTQLSTGNRFFQAPPLWLSIDQAATFADVIGTIFQQLGKPLSIMDNRSPAGQIAALFTLLDMLELPRLIVLDQFDNLLDWTTGKALFTQSGVGEWIDALNSRPWKSNGRLLLTSRPFPQGTRVATSLYFQEYPVGGLTPQEGFALLRSRGIQATEGDLQKAVTFCDGHPLSLVLLMALIPLYGIPLADLLLAAPTLWIGDIATNLLDAMFQHLTKEQRAVLCALSIYRTAVPVAALAPFLRGSSFQKILLSLRPLLVQQVIQPAGNGRYQVHTVVGRYARDHFVEGDEQANQQAVFAAHANAAKYYLQQAKAFCPPREKRLRVSDAQPLIETMWQYTQAAQWREAYKLGEQEDLFESLRLWGGNVLLLELCQQLLPNASWQPERDQEANIYIYLGNAYDILGKKQEALDYYQKALTIYLEEGDRKDEGGAFHYMGQIYSDLGKKQEALDYYQKALAIYLEVGDRRDEGGALHNMGQVYSDLGKKQEALDYYQKALTIYREVGDREDEGGALHNMGQVYSDLGKKQEALDYYQKALTIYREVGDREDEGGALHDLGQVYNDLGEKQKALDHFQQALTIYREVGVRGDEGGALHDLGKVYSDLGKKQEALDYYKQALQISQEVGDRGDEGGVLHDLGKVSSDQGQTQDALDYYQQALRIRQEIGDRWGEGATRNDLGEFYSTLGQKQEALDYYQQALQISREVEDRGGEGKTLHNMGALYFERGRHDVALACFLLARGIFEEVQSPNRDKVQNWIDDLHRKVGEKQFTALLAQVEPQAYQIVERALPGGERHLR